MESVIEQLVDIHYKYENWIKNKLPVGEAHYYHLEMIQRRNIVWVHDKQNKVLGYCQFFRLNFEQWGRMVCHAPFYDLDENTTDGNICVVNNVWIHPDHRRSNVFIQLKELFYQENHHCEYYVGLAERKSANLIKVFKKSELRSKLFKEGIKAGV